MIRDTSFTLVVDDFGTYTTSCADLDHLHSAINSKYTARISYTGSLYIGMTLKWDYQQRHINVNVSILGHINYALVRSNVTLSHYPQYSPHVCNPINYGAPTQFTNKKQGFLIIDTTDTTVA